MKVRLLQSFPRHAPGDLWECDEAEAARLVEAGIAEHCDPRPSPPVVERAVAPKRERAVPSKGRRRRKREGDADAC